MRGGRRRGATGSARFRLSLDACEPLLKRLEGFEAVKTSFEAVKTSLEAVERPLAAVKNPSE